MQLYKDKTAENRTAGSFFSNERRANSFFPKENTNEQVFRLQNAGTFDILSGRAPVVQLCSFNPNCPNPDPCPVHGTYTQGGDPTMNSYMANGENYVGLKAMKKEMNGEVPKPNEVRAKTFKHASLHEGIPTNLAPMVAENRIPGTIGGQSGIRTCTVMTFFLSDRDDSIPPRIIAHSGALRKDGKPNSFAMTENQAAMHDKLREAYYEVKAGYNPSARGVSIDAHANVARILQELIDILAPGQMLSSIMIGQIKSLSGPCPVTCVLTGKALNSKENINELASAVGNAREEVKHRYVDFCVRYRIPHYRPPSPPRSRFGRDGSGGGYTGEPQYTPRPFPNCKDPEYPDDIERQIANETAYITQPLRDRDRYYVPPPPPPERE